MPMNVKMNIYIGTDSKAEQLEERIKKHAAKEGKSLSEWIVEAMKEKLQRESRQKAY